jgi:hypothetical protein
MIFQGKKEKAELMFEQLGFRLPEFMNPSDYYMKLLNK